MPIIEKSERREAARRRERYGQRGQAKWWLNVSRSQDKRAQALEERAMRRQQGQQHVSKDNGKDTGEH